MLPAALLDLGRNNATNEVSLLYFCCHNAGFALYPITSKKFIVSCVYQLCLLAFTISFLSAVWGLPCHGVVISRFKIGFEFIKVQVNGSMYLTVRKNLSALLDYTGL